MLTISDRIVTCSPVVLEALHKPDSPAKYEAAYIDYFDPLDWLPLDTDAAERAVEVQREMAQASTGNHRRGAVDFLIAAVAEVAGPEYVLWHFDRDLRLICQHTGQAQEAEDSTGPGR